MSGPFNSEEAASRAQLGQTCPPETILEEAGRIINGPRRATYGHPRDNIKHTAQMWSIIMKKEVTERDVINCMIALKLCRDVQCEKRDNMVDICGYCAISELIGD